MTATVSRAPGTDRAAARRGVAAGARRPSPASPDSARRLTCHHLGRLEELVRVQVAGLRQQAPARPQRGQQRPQPLRPHAGTGSAAAPGAALAPPGGARPPAEAPQREPRAHAPAQRPPPAARAAFEREGQRRGRAAAPRSPLSSPSGGAGGRTVPPPLPSPLNPGNR